MKSVGVFDAKTRLSELIESGEPVTITKHGKPVATLTPVRRDVADAIARIRALRCLEATEADIARTLRASRR